MQCASNLSKLFEMRRIPIRTPLKWFNFKNHIHTTCNSSSLLIMGGFLAGLSHVRFIWTVVQSGRAWSCRNRNTSFAYLWTSCSPPPSETCPLGPDKPPVPLFTRLQNSWASQAAILLAPRSRCRRNYSIGLMAGDLVGDHNRLITSHLLGQICAPLHYLLTLV